jgi:hypothetical protein
VQIATGVTQMSHGQRIERQYQNVLLTRVTQSRARKRKVPEDRGASRIVSKVGIDKSF